MNANHITADILREAVAAREADLIRLRRDLHQHPELAFEEVRTSGIVAERLAAAGLEVRRGLAKTGVVGTLRGGHPGRTVLLRADIDALPIQEQNDVDYRSRNDGAMHACGHDGHTAVAVVVAETLGELRRELPGNVVFMFQPAEETIGGARPMIEQGVLADPPVEAAFGVHLWNNLPVGTIGIRPGPVFASTDEFALRIIGKGGHGALPHQAVDAIVASAQVISALQTLVSRTVPPLEPAVLTIGTIRGGTAFNIIAEAVEMTGTLRTFDRELREYLLARLEEVVRGVTSGLRASYELSLRGSCPAVINHVAMSDLARRVASTVVREDGVVTAPPTMGGDDFAFVLERVPGCYALVGSANPARGLDRPHHNPEFDIDEAALAISARFLAGVAVEYLTSGVGG